MAAVMEDSETHLAQHAASVFGIRWAGADAVVAVEVTVDAEVDGLVQRRQEAWIACVDHEYTAEQDAHVLVEDNYVDADVVAAEVGAKLL